MPLSDYQPQVEELAATYEEAGVLLTALLATAATGATAAALAQIAATARGYLTALLDTSAQWVRINLPRVYLTGVERALRATGDPGESSAIEVVQSAEHREALQTLMQSLMADLQNAASRMERDFNSSLSDIRRRYMAQALASGGRGSDVVEQARQMGSQMRERGVRFVDRANRRWKPEVYAETVLLTHVASTLNTSMALAAIEVGSPGVLVADGQSGDTDRPCMDANGQVWSWSVWLANLLAHPRCTRDGEPLPLQWRGTLDRKVV